MTAVDVVRHIVFTDPLHAHCDTCGAGLTCSTAHQMWGLARRHVAESHPDPVPPSSPPATVPTASP